MKVEVQKWGNSGAIRLPAAIMEQFNLALGDHLDLQIEERKIVLVPAHHAYRLEDLVAGITTRNLHAPVDFGAPLGREAW
jgi:antitoxin component of MazEF toxin-antitoxin module